MDPQTADASSASAPSPTEGRQISASPQATPKSRSASSLIVQNVTSSWAVLAVSTLVSFLLAPLVVNSLGSVYLRCMGTLESVHRVSLAVRLRCSGVCRQVRCAIPRVRRTRQTGGDRPDCHLRLRARVPGGARHCQLHGRRAPVRVQHPRRRGACGTDRGLRDRRHHRPELSDATSSWACSWACSASTSSRRSASTTRR